MNVADVPKTEVQPSVNYARRAWISLNLCLLVLVTIALMVGSAYLHYLKDRHDQQQLDQACIDWALDVNTTVDDRPSWC